MIFEKREFDQYCFGKTYESTLDIHLFSYEILKYCYGGFIDGSVEEWLKKQTVIDAGCAMGHVIKDLTDSGINCYGYEISNYAIKNAIKSVRHRMIKSDHNTMLGSLVDNACSILLTNSFQYSKDERQIESWVCAAKRICSHSMIFISTTIQSLNRCISGSRIFEMQIVKPSLWWEHLFLGTGFSRVKWINGAMAICLK